ncbi:hypothetical protein ACOJ0Y_17060 [Morganella morganii]|uniref:hypothetical protein n=1 Tax=Morganella morganii TaxID=582 RepID=UPI001BDAAC24|nr:hypothetical protein [Morganella morganii]EKU4003206.1 hypothetical protein [Morganella morganii]MBT0407989.1 hypothetical protein [Morganella morganii subsp. morganii]MBT0425773.1 hypothetical protein [Morganella morganii subsp. morganii]MBT0473200.1 hypothetical protein [Morganella morganii subsp. morganii]QWM01494.1 hypothetical protein IZ188_05205 [Morganella morganii subsp. morganii]
MAQLINKPIVNGLTPVSHNGKIVACTADGRVVGGLISCSVDSCNRELVTMTITVEVVNSDGELVIGGLRGDERQQIESNQMKYQPKRPAGQEGQILPPPKKP